VILGERRLGATTEAAFEGRATLDQILRRLAATKGDALAMLDPTDRPAVTDGAPRRLTWAQLDDQVERLARCLTGMGLGRDCVVAVQLPNTVENVVTLFGILRAGMIAALMPLAWRQREITWALGRVGAKAAITMVRIGPVAHAGIMTQAAVENFGLRFVCAFGRGAPDGVQSLDEAMKDDSWAELPPETRAGNPGDHVAVVTFDATAEGFVPVARSHNNLIVAGLAHLVETRIEAGDVLATALLPSSIAGLATGVMTSVLSGAKLLMHQPFSSSVLSGAIVTSGASHVVLPGVVADLLGGARLPFPPLRGLTAVRRDPREVPNAALAGFQRNELISLGEFGFVSRRAGETVGTIPAGRVPVSRNAPKGMQLIETRIGKDGVLEVRGPVAPAGEFPGRRSTDAALGFDVDRFVATGWNAVVEEDRLTIKGSRTGVTLVGGIALPTDPTLAAVRQALGCPPEDAAFVPDRVLGSRLAVVETEGEDMARRLRNSGFTAALGVATEEVAVPEAEAEVA
jgi:hypothetical protein